MTAVVRERSRSDAALAVASEAELTLSCRLAGLVEVGIELASARSVADLVEAVVGHGLSALGADGGAVGVCDHDQGTIRLTTTVSLGAHTQLVYGSIPLDGPLPAAVAARTGEPVLLGDQVTWLAFSPAMAAVYAEVGRPAWAAFPLTVGRRLLGSITISWDGPQQLVERRDSDIDAGLERLGASASRLRALPLEDLCDALLAELAPNAEDDDVLLAVRAHPTARLRPSEAGPEQLPEDMVVDQA